LYYLYDLEEFLTDNVIPKENDIQWLVLLLEKEIIGKMREEVIT